MFCADAGGVVGIDWVEWMELLALHSELAFLALTSFATAVNPRVIKLYVTTILK